jgi:PST family polysaccharide transporter
VYRRSLTTVGLLTLPVTVLLMLLAPQLVMVFLGSQWDSVVLPFQILAAGILFRASFVLVDALGAAKGAVFRVAWRTWLNAVMVVAGAAVGQRWGVPGVAAGVLFATVANFIVMVQLGLKLTGLSRASFVKAHRAGAATALTAGIAGWSTIQALGKISAPPLLMIMITSLAALIAVAWTWRFAPALFLGSDGKWALDLLATRFRQVAKYRRRTPGAASSL